MRATAVLRRPVAQMMFFFSAMGFSLLLHYLRLLRLMRMLGARVYLQLVEHPPAKTVLRQHPAYGDFYQALGFLGFEDLARGRGADAARIGGMPVVNLFLEFLAGQLDLGGIDDDDEIAG